MFSAKKCLVIILQSLVRGFQSIQCEGSKRSRGEDGNGNHHVIYVYLVIQK